VASIAAFRGLVYNASRIPDLKPVVAPPYDVISAEKAEELRARDPHNVVHLDLPEGDPPAKYARAAALLAQWREEGVLVRDEAPSLYVTSQRYAVRGMPERTRWGFIGLLRIEEDAAGIVLPHERTMDAPRADRRELIAATRTQISSVFVLYSDPAASISASIDAVAHRPADHWVSDEAGVDTRLWRISDPETLRSVREGLADHRILIADGHHRYAASRDARDRFRASAPGDPPGSRSYDYLMAYFSNLEAPGLTILPYHRVMRGVRGFDSSSLARKVEGLFDLKRFPFEGFDHRAEQIRRRLREVAERGRLAIGLYAGGAEFALMVLKAGQESSPPFSEIPAPLRVLDVSVLQHGILEGALGITAEAVKAGGLVRYTEEVERAIDWVDAGEGQVAFLLNMPRREQLMAVADAGLQMPQKSTFFYPKVITGLVMNSLDPIDEVAAQPDPASLRTS
jgi:uncharacterized protein (DUF1015 family)